MEVIRRSKYPKTGGVGSRRRGALENILSLSSRKLMFMRASPPDIKDLERAGSKKRKVGTQAFFHKAFKKGGKG